MGRSPSEPASRRSGVTQLIGGSLMPMLSNRTGEVVATEDENADGRLDQHDERMAAKRSAPATRAAPAKLAPARPAPAADADAPVVVPATKGPRPRASLTATLSLILGVG